MAFKASHKLFAALLRLAAVNDDAGLRERGRRTIEAFRDRWGKAAHAMPQMLCALERALEQPPLALEQQEQP